MNLLLLHSTIRVDEEAHRELARRGHRVVNHPFRAVDRRKNIHQILKELPDGFRPDAIVCWSADYQGIPGLIEEADALTVIQVNDYHLAFSYLQPHLRRFDAIWTDALGVQLLSRGGFRRFVQSPLYSYGADVPEIEMPAKDLDLVFVGGMNHAVHQERSFWLRRIARLADKHKVLVAGGIFGKAYFETLARGKIVFNQSVRGEMNMRCFEAPMLGCLPTIERGNLETFRYFPDGEAHVAYDERDFEEKIDYYLARPQERERIVANARAIAARMLREQVFQLVEELERLGPSDKLSRSWHSSKPERQLVASACNTLYSWAPETEELASEMLCHALEVAPEDAEALCALGFQSLLQAGRLEGAARHAKILEASDWFARSLKANEAYLPALISLGGLALEMQKWKEGERHFRKCRDLTRGENLSLGLFQGLYYPIRFDYFRMARERILLNRFGDLRESVREQGQLFRLRSCEGLALALAAQGKTEEALENLQEAYECSEKLADPHPLLFLSAAMITWNVGDEEAAIAFGERLDLLVPLQPEFWEIHLARMIAARKFRQALAKAQDYAVCAKGFVVANEKEALFRNTVEMIRNGGEGFDLWEQAAQLVREGREAEAERAFRAAYPLCRGSSMFALDFALLLMKMEKTEEAFPLLELAKSDAGCAEAATAYAAEARARLAKNQTAPNATAATNIP